MPGSGIAAGPLFIASVRLSACIPLPAPYAKKVPEKVLPPSFGVLLMRRPPFCISADSAPVVKVTSSIAASFM